MEWVNYNVGRARGVRFTTAEIIIGSPRVNYWAKGTQLNIQAVLEPQKIIVFFPPIYHSSVDYVADAEEETS